MESIIKPHLAYDGEGYIFPASEDISSILATHGSTIEAAGDLITTGSFNAGHRVSSGITGLSPLGSEFYATPNPNFNFDAYQLKGDKFNQADLDQTDAIMTGIYYAESGDTDYEGGVVIALSGKAALLGMEIHVDTLAHIDPEKNVVLELVLPVTPSINQVQGIYPIDEMSHKNLVDYITKQ